MGSSSYRACFSFHSSYLEVKDFLSYICPVNIYPNVIPLGKTLEDVAELLKPLCRKQSGREEIVYKPLGALKRTRKRCTSEGSDSDNDLFEEVSMASRRRKMTVTDLTKVAISEQPHSPKKDSHDTDQTFSLIEPCPPTHSSNYMDCTESNDDDDDDDDAEQPPVPQPFGVAPPCTEMPCSKPAQSDSSQSKTALPCWDRFFKVEPVLTDESELDNSQNSHNTQTLSTENTASQSPELFQDEVEDDSSSVHLTSSQSTHISDAGTESLSQIDTVLVQVDESKAITSEQCNRGTNGEVVSSHNVEPKEEEAVEPKSDSQVSSDFELPPTPGSKVPQPEELKELYRKLAAGEEVVIRQIV
ncbi:protein artemis-like [Sinocyclocheilus grahami]|nr:PREDICTED: protein artemis-like [Sinocyclocheilus grahami]